MPRKRNSENKGFPTGWRKLHGAIYYSVPRGMEPLWDDKKLFPLGKTAPEAYRIWAERMETPDAAQTIGQLLDRYALQVIPTKAPKSQSGDLHNIKKVRKAFGHIFLNSLLPRHVYKYVDARSAKVSAKREVALLSHAFTKAVEWGYINKHPFKGEIRLAGEKARTRYVEQWEIDECLSLPPMRKQGSVRSIQAYIKLKIITGLRRGDLLRLRITDCCDDGIHVTPHKTAGSSGKSLVILWTNSLREAVDMAKDARPVDIAPWLFCTKRGECYLDEINGEAHGWASMWGRFMDRVLSGTKLTERFTEHDLRAKAGSDCENREHARTLLAHTDGKITDRVYRRKAEFVQPVK